MNLYNSTRHKKERSKEKNVLTGNRGYIDNFLSYQHTHNYLELWITQALPTIQHFTTTTKKRKPVRSRSS